VRAQGLPGERRARGVLVELLGFVGSEQRVDVGQKIVIFKLAEHALLGLRARDRVARCAEILAEAGDHARHIEMPEHRFRVGEVDQVASLVALQEGAKLGREHFFP
jgi:hypothetical protein